MRVQAESQENIAKLKLLLAEYLQDSKMKAKGPWQLYLKALFVFTLLLLAYFLLLYLGPKGYIGLVILSVFYGFIMVVVQFNIMHDGSHRSFSSKEWVNKMASNIIMIAGASPSLWRIKHVKLHHSAPGLFGTDTDIDQGPVFRFHKDGCLRKFHRYQHLYALPLYCCLLLYWTPRDLLLARKDKKLPVDVFIAIFINILFHIIIPLIVFQSILKVLVFFLVYNFTLGLIISLVFVPAHTCSKVRMFSKNEESNLDSIEQQTAATADFNPQSKLLNFLTGGLNNQTTHHLFTGICHLHYPKLQPLVEKFCRENNLQYNKFPTFRAGIWDHFRYIRMMGRRE